MRTLSKRSEDPRNDKNGDSGHGERMNEAAVGVIKGSKSWEHNELVPDEMQNQD